MQQARCATCHDLDTAESSCVYLARVRFWLPDLRLGALSDLGLQVLMVTQQAAAALTTDDSQAVQPASVVKAVAACLCEHFRYVVPPASSTSRAVCL